MAPITTLIEAAKKGFEVEFRSDEMSLECELFLTNNAEFPFWLSLIVSMPDIGQEIYWALIKVEHYWTAAVPVKYQANPFFCRNPGSCSFLKVKGIILKVRLNELSKSACGKYICKAQNLDTKEIAENTIYVNESIDFCMLLSGISMS